MRRPTSALVLCGALAMLSGCGGSANRDINRLEAQVEQLNSSVAELNDQIDALSDDLAETAEQTTTEQRRTARRLSLLARNTKALQSGLYDVAFEAACGYPLPPEGAGASVCQVPCGAIRGICTDADTGEFLGDRR